MTYRGVEKAFVVHRQIELGLDALDGHHTEPHWDQVEHGCTNTHTHTHIKHTSTHSKQTCTHTANTEGNNREKSSSISMSHLVR